MPHRKMPATVYETFEPLHIELVGIHDLWSFYCQLFEAGEDRIYLLRRVASPLFGAFRWAMYLDAALALCRLTDPANSSPPKKPPDRDNLTVERLVEAVEKDDGVFGSKLRATELVAVVDWRDTHFARFRDKRAAHNDLTTSREWWKGKLNPGRPSPEQIETMLQLAASLLNRVAEHYSAGRYEYGSVDGDGRYLPRPSHIGYDGDKLIGVLAEYADWHDAGLKDGSRSAPSIHPPKHS